MKQFLFAGLLVGAFSGVASATSTRGVPPQSILSNAAASDVVALVRLGEEVPYKNPDAPSWAPSYGVTTLVVEEAFKGSVGEKIYLVGDPPLKFAEDQAVLVFLKGLSDPGVYNRCCHDSFLQVNLFGELYGRSGPVLVGLDGTLQHVDHSEAEQMERMKTRFPSLMDRNFARPTTADGLAALDTMPERRPQSMFSREQVLVASANDAAEIQYSASFEDVMVVTRHLLGEL